MHYKKLAVFFWTGLTGFSGLLLACGSEAHVFNNQKSCKILLSLSKKEFQRCGLFTGLRARCRRKSKSGSFGTSSSYQAKAGKPTTNRPLNPLRRRGGRRPGWVWFEDEDRCAEDEYENRYARSAFRFIDLRGKVAGPPDSPLSCNTEASPLASADGGSGGPALPGMHRKLRWARGEPALPIKNALRGFAPQRVL